MDTRALRQVAGHFATGVTVIAMDLEGEIRAMTASSFTSLSLDPPLVLFCAGKTTKTGQVVRSASGFAVNILRHDQEALSTYFAGGWARPEPPPFHFVSWTGGPRLEGCAAALGCSIEAVLEGGDHWIVIGRVQSLHHGVEPCDPLLVHRGRYHRLTRADGDPAPDLQATTPTMLAYYDPWGE